MREMSASVTSAHIAVIDGLTGPHDRDPVAENLLDLVELVGNKVDGIAPAFSGLFSSTNSSLVSCRGQHGGGGRRE